MESDEDGLEIKDQPGSPSFYESRLSVGDKLFDQENNEPER